VLAGPLSHGALVGAMIGCNPAAFGVAELNLFVADTLEGALLDMARHKQVQMHGLLRTVAQLVAGEQSIAAIAMARRWVMSRLHWPARRVFDEIRSRAEPFRVVDKSRAHLSRAENLKRMAEACPDARYAHIVRDVRADPGVPAANVEGVALFRSIPELVPGSAKLDPERIHAEVEERIAVFLQTVPSERQVEVRAELLLAEPKAAIADLCTALALPTDEDAVAAMLRPEDSPFARFGPPGASFGDDLEFLRAPKLRPSAPESAEAGGRLG
jgi:hypothetical protein